MSKTSPIIAGLSVSSIVALSFTPSAGASPLHHVLHPAAVGASGQSIGSTATTATAATAPSATTASSLPTATATPATATPAAGTPAPIAACPSGAALGAADQYSEFASGNATRGQAAYTDDEGAVAYGGNASFDRFFVGEYTGSKVSPALVVGGAASGTAAVLSGGNGVVGSGSVTSPNPPSATNITTGAAPFSFSALHRQQLLDSALYGSEVDNAGSTVAQSGTVLTLTGTDPTLDVFNLAPGQFASAEPIAVEVPASATVLVNVPDAVVTDGALNYISYNGETGGQYNSAATDKLKADTLFNFPNAVSLSLIHAAFAGNILAPSAAFSFNSGQLDGSVFAKSISGDFEGDYTGPFTGCTPYTPPPTTPGSCPQGSAFGVADQYAEFATGDANRGSANYTDDEGAAAYGGKATFDKFYVGEFVGATVDPALVVGGKATGSVAVLSGGRGVIGSGSVTNPSTPGAATNVSVGSAPFSFAAVGAALSSASAYYGAETSTAGATVTDSGGVLTLTGTNPRLDVFDLAPGQFAAAQPINIDVPTTATVLVNVPDASVVDKALNYISYNGETGGQFNSPAVDTLRDDTLFNFPNAVTLSLTHAAFAGHILAPSARFDFSSGQLDGSVFAKSVNGDFQTDSTAPFGGCPK